jgi:membrane protein DedA with SNARE-associated domain
MPTLDQALVLLREYGYALLFILALVEGPIVTVLGAFLAAQNYFNIFIVYGVVVTGDLVGDILYYAAGRFGRTHLLERFSGFTGLSPERLTWLERYWESHGAKALIVAKYTQTGFIALPAAGAARMPIGPFLLYNLAATLPKAFALCVLGYLFGAAYHSIDSWMERVSIVLGLAVCLAVLLYFLRERREQKEH